MVKTVFYTASNLQAEIDEGKNTIFCIVNKRESQRIRNIGELRETSTHSESGH